MIIDILAGLFSGILGAMGLGGGGILVLYLTQMRDITQLNAQGINLIFFVPTAFTALFLHTKNKLVDWKIAVKLIIAGLFGILPGLYLITNIDENILTKVFAGMLIFVGIKNLLTKNQK